MDSKPPSQHDGWLGALIATAVAMWITAGIVVTVDATGGAMHYGVVLLILAVTICASVAVSQWIHGNRVRRYIGQRITEHTQQTIEHIDQRIDEVIRHIDQRIGDGMAAVAELRDLVQQQRATLNTETYEEGRAAGRAEGMQETIASLTRLVEQQGPGATLASIIPGTRRPG